MIDRPFWRRRIEQAWRQAPIVWLAGVRRVGKTVLAQSMGSEKIRYLDCDLPVAAQMVEDPEFFYRNCDRPVVIFDEIHQLKNPSRVLKIGADHFGHLKILATGSSTLAASSQFRDTLAGRKRQVHLVPVLWDEMAGFDNAPPLRRLYHGGLPQALMSREKRPEFYREWIDSLFARDIQKLFSFRAPEKFNALFEYVMKQSGGLFEVTRAAGSLGISRPTVESHLQALAATHVVTLLRPFHAGGQKEIVKMPKVYGFDTGFVSFCRGWHPLRPDDYGLLWEHIVLEFLQAHEWRWPIHYWRDAAGRELDFVIPRGRDAVDAIECKWDPAHFDHAAVKLFRSYYPRGRNFVISPQSVRSYARRLGGLEIMFCNPEGWKATADSSS